MKTRILTILAILALNIYVSFGSSDISFTGDIPVERIIINLAPVAPAIADFSDVVPEPACATCMLMPVTPTEATFDDENSLDNVVTRDMLKSIIPVTPKEAGFDEDQPDTATTDLLPFSPKEADFDENL